jgi:uncharacterized membrane protein YobD (UPF0266 family)
MLKKLTLLFTLIIIPIQPVLAYFDPGLGSSVVQGIIALLSIIILYLKKPKYLLIDGFNFFKKLFFNKNKKNK